MEGEGQHDRRVTTSTVTRRLSARRRRTRTNFTTWQMQQLERAFSSGHYPDVVIRESLAVQLQLSEARIQVYSRGFQPFTHRVSRKDKAINGVRLFPLYLLNRLTS